VIAALGGMLAPAAVYLALSATLGAPVQGWPIPLATDIAFALAVFGLVGRGLPSSLRVFLLTLAIVDDLGAIALIAVLFSEGLRWMPLAVAGGVLALGAVVGARRRIPAPFWVLGFAVVWWLAVEAGLSTSLSSVAFAAIVPITPRACDNQSPLKEAMHDMHPYVAFLILPLFAFAKAGVSFSALSLSQALSPLVLAVAAGLFIGKQIGVFGAAALTTGLKLGAKPSQSTWLQLYGVALLCGVGFTMSLFLGVLAFPGAPDSALQTEVRLGVLGGSLLSAIVGAIVLALAPRRQLFAEEPPEESP
jgi:NhaA family Na+:H+ antiporter